MRHYDGLLMSVLTIAPKGFSLTEVLATSPWFSTLALERDGALFIGKRAARAMTDATDALRDESRVLELLDGRGAPRLVARGDDDAGPFLVMTRVLGETPLANRIGLFPKDAAERLVEAAFRALHNVHSASDSEGPLGLVHGDIHPGNVLASTDGSEVTLIDFGLATFRGARRISSGAFRGSAHYASPEAARGEPTDARSDRFSLSVTLLHALCGVAPRQTKTLPSTILEAAEIPLEPYAKAHSSILPERIAKVLTRCVAFNPNDRPAANEPLF